eukprot:CAMPEP_0174839318 /NCGR_PEP_ID=MMETSP1114-20130205/7964_1 /TAXON_ID=312471 /ORGANISM="Neobodo designis, Strain CCAP 1951/1" /LENGTH=186 /DNA_ID=CAMNT_0016073439 /DNA_START=29 /DNA_END=586 /DNA_ORIENTATION=+
MKPTEVVYSVLSAAAFVALSTVVWVSLNPPAFGLGRGLSGRWQLTGVSCGDGIEFPRELVLSLPDREETDVFESLSLPFDAPLVRVGPVTMNLSRSSFERRWSGAATWSRTDTCVTPRNASCTLLLRNQEMVLWLMQPAMFCSVAWMKVETSDPLQRKLMSAGLIVAIVVGIHTVLSRLRPSSRAV